MEITNPRTRSLVRQADRVANAGKRAAAANLYRQIIDEAPETPQAWVGLASVINDVEDKESAYNQALQLDPENEAAIRGLALLRGEEPPAPTVETGQESVEISPPSDSSRSDIDDILEASGARLEVSTVPLDDSAKEKEPLVEPKVEDFQEIDHVHDTKPDSVEDHIHESEFDVVRETEILYCANHPGRQTHLRCNRCGKPICSSCAKPTPVGYRCPECIREQEDVYYSARPVDYVIAILIALPLAFLAGFVASLISFLAIFLAAFAGSLVGRIVFRATGRRRGRGIPEIVAATMVLGGAYYLVFDILRGNILGAVFMGIYVATAAGSAYWQMR